MLWYAVSNYREFCKYDVVISFCNPVFGYSSYMKRLGLLRHTRLYTLVHHLTNHNILGPGYDGIFFLSEQIMNKAKDRYPSLAPKMNYLQWGPDTNFYEETYNGIKTRDTEGKPVFISNGKTGRDLDLLEKACDELDVPVIIITDKAKNSKNVVASGVKGKNAIKDIDMLGYMKHSDISVVPVVPRPTDTGLCGLTSVLDALALGQPLIMSDNTNVSIDIEALKIGKLYKAGDKESLKSAMRFFLDNPMEIKEYGRRAREYALKYTYIDYCKQLEKLISKA